MKIPYKMKLPIAGKVAIPLGLMGDRHRQIIRSFIPSGRMLEWGSGWTTLWLRSKGVDVISIEHDEKWANKTGAIYVRYLAGRNGTLDEERLYPGWSDYVNYPFKLNPNKFNTILIDGVVRNECLKIAGKLLLPKGSVFLHDAQRSWYPAATAHFAHHEDLGACNDAVPGETLWRLWN